jgi:hypothetical protein
MEEDALDNINDIIFPKNSSSTSWHSDAAVKALSEDLFSHLKQTKQQNAENGELESESPEYKHPEDPINITNCVNQRICFNLIRHRGTTSDILTMKLFKSFMTTLKKADPSLIILPFASSKPHYSSLPTIKHIQSMECEYSLDPEVATLFGREIGQSNGDVLLTD